MLNISDKQVKLLLEYLPDIQDYVFSGDIHTVLLELDDKITEVGFDADYNLNAVGLQLQELYDQLFEQN